MERITYKRHRGYHHYNCQFCGKEHRERIPDQASDDYQHNPGNPILGICVNCNHGVGAGAIRILPHSLLPGHKGIDTDSETTLNLSRRIFDLPINWRKCAEIALKFMHKAREQDQEDLRGEILLRIAEIARKRNENGETLTEPGMIRIASYVVLEYWKDQREITSGLDCGHCSKEQRVNCREKDSYSQCPKLVKIVSLSQEIENGEGDSIELWETIADDKAIDLEAWIDSKLWLASCPRRLIEIANKKAGGEALTEAERKYFCKLRKREFCQKDLFEG